MMQGTKITELEADKLIGQGIAQMFDLESSHCSGFFECTNSDLYSQILIITDKGYFLRSREDLVKSKDEVFVGFCEDGENLPNFEDVFKIRKM